MATPDYKLLGRCGSFVGILLSRVAKLILPPPPPPNSCAMNDKEACPGGSIMSEWLGLMKTECGGC